MRMKYLKRLCFDFRCDYDELAEDSHIDARFAEIRDAVTVMAPSLECISLYLVSEPIYEVRERTCQASA